MTEPTKLTAAEVETLRRDIEEERPLSPVEMAATITPADVEAVRAALARPVENIAEAFAKIGNDITASWGAAKGQIAEAARVMAETLAAQEAAAAEFYRFAFDRTFADYPAERELALAERATLEALTEKAARDLDSDLAKRLRASSSPEERASVIEEIRSVYTLASPSRPAWPMVRHFLHDESPPELDPAAHLSPAEHLVRGLAYRWPAVVTEWRERNAAKIAAAETIRTVLASAKKPEEQDPDAQHPEAVARLTVAVDRHRAAILPHLAAPPGDDLAVETSRCVEAAGVRLHACPAALAEQLEQRLGAGGKANAALLRRAAADGLAAYLAQTVADGVEPPAPPWTLWASPVTAANWIAAAAWDEEVRPALGRDRHNPPALSLAVVHSIGRTFYEKDRQVSFLPPADGTGSVVIVGADGEELARTAVLPARELEEIRSGALRLRSYVGHLVLRGFTDRGWEQTRAGVPSPSILGWEGGLAECAHSLGAKSNKAREELREVLEAGQAFRREWAGGEIGGLWTYALQRAAPGRRGYLEVRLGRPLMPYMVKTLGPRERTLVPLPPMPPTVSAERTWAAQAALQMAVVALMAERRVELVTYGGARIAPEEWRRMARAVGLSSDLLPAVLDRWTQDGTDGLACLTRVGDDRFHLPNNAAYRDARAFLEAGGRRSLERKKAGEASVRAAATKRRRAPKTTA